MTAEPLEECGCGGKPQGARINRIALPAQVFQVYCQKCGIATLEYTTAAESTAVWNKAMRRSHTAPQEE